MQNARQTIIKDAIGIHGEKEFAEWLATTDSPGKYECVKREDIPLVVAIEVIWGHGYADDQGDNWVEVDGYRVYTDDQGFVTLGYPEE